MRQITRTKICNLDKNISKHFGLDLAAIKGNPGLEIWGCH